MTDAKKDAAEAAVPLNGELIDIGTISAHNLVHALGLGEEKVGEVRQAIRDEIGAMSSHFTLAVADVETAYQVEVNKAKAKYAADVAEIKSKSDAYVAEIKSTFNYVKANAVKIAAIVVALLGVGALIGHFA